MGSSELEIREMVGLKTGKKGEELNAENLSNRLEVLKAKKPNESRELQIKKIQQLLGLIEFTKEENSKSGGDQSAPLENRTPAAGKKSPY